MTVLAMTEDILLHGLLTANWFLHCLGRNWPFVQVNAIAFRPTKLEGDGRAEWSYCRIRSPP